MKSIRIFFISIFAVSLFIAAAVYATDGGALATITRIKGTPLILKAASSESKTAVIGETVEYGDTISTDQDSKATLVFNDGEIRVITSGSSVKFNESGNEQLTQVAKITSTLAEAINARNLDNTFISVTGAKLSMNSADKKQADKKSEGIQMRGAEKQKDLNVTDGPAYERTAPPISEAEIPGSSKQSPLPPTPMPESAQLPAAQSTSSDDESCMGGSQSISEPEVKIDIPERIEKPSTTKKKHLKSETAVSAIVKTSSWGFWYDDENSIPWRALIMPYEADKIEKITVTASNPADVKGIDDKLSITDKNEKFLNIVVLYKSKSPEQKRMLKNMRAKLKIDAARHEKAAADIKAIEHLRADDLETYLYIKAGIFKQYEFYIAALAALEQLENLKPDTVMRHVLKSKVIIYYNMQEIELAKNAAKKLSNNSK